MSSIDSGLRNLAANTLRALAIDGVNAADSGHPGAPMGMADIAVALFAEVLRFDPSAPGWMNPKRGRPVPQCGSQSGSSPRRSRARTAILRG